ncbi:MAX gene-associated protein-like isoform X1 [Leucoraja erinacea]|uniref:MAX gene-associated protein-like isoform X1 n=1 Tax=Leucoraja erinaceus TaxID=7782 RepID=UPI002456CD06|nr:MAX gene-associated protein-like isoform X1 [Leucoraja erinacea]XP_055496985.1 MAX gene-associated protein-like isoform X1 [Leucoraja erinacea]
MPKKKGHAGWSRHNRIALREATRRRRAQETPYERAEKNERKKTAHLRKQQERERDKRNEDRHERARNRNMPRRGIKRKAALSRNDAKRHRGAARSRREQEMQQKRIEHLRVQQERLRNRRLILTPVRDQKVEKLWNTSLLIQKSLQENSKEKMSATVTACNLNRSRNSTMIEGVSNHPETSNSPHDLSQATKTDRPQFLYTPRPAHNPQLTSDQKMILQPLRCPGANLFQYPNGQIVELVPLPNPGPVSRPYLHQKVTPAVRNPGSGSGNCVPTAIKSCSVALYPSNVTLCPKGIIPQRGRPRSTPVVKPACVALKQTSSPQPISAVASEVPVQATSQPPFVNGVGQTINAWHLVPLQPVAFALLQLPQGQKSVSNTIITAGKSLKLTNQSSGSQLFEKAGYEKTANQNNKAEEKLIEPGLEEIHVADSELIETTVSRGVPDEDHVNADPLPEVKQETDAFPSTPSVSDADDDSIDHQNALEHPTPAELVDRSHTGEEQIVEDENENSALENSTSTGKGSSVDKDSSRSNHEVVNKEPEEMPSMEEKNRLHDEQVEVEMEDKKCWFEASTFNVPVKREEDMLKNPENDELDFHQKLLQYENFCDSDKETGPQSNLVNGDSQSDAEKIDVERMFDSTSSEAAMDIETVEELSEKINIALLTASASRLTSKSNIPNIYSTNPSNVAPSEYHEEPFKIIVKEETPDDYEYNHAANPVILDCDGLKCKEEKEFSDSVGWDGGTNCDLQNKTMNKSYINEVDATSSAVNKQPLIIPMGVAKCFPSIYSTNPSSVAPSEYNEELFKIIVKEEPPDDYEYNHAAHPVILDCDGLKCKEKKEFLDSEGRDGGTNCDSQNKTMNKGSINEVDAISSAVTKQPLISPTGVAKAKMMRLECTKVLVVYLEPCTFTNGTIKISELPQKLLSSCRRKGGPIPTVLQFLNSAKYPTHSQVENVDSKSVCSGPKESSSASEKNVNKTSTSTVSNNPTVSHGTPSEKTSGEGFRFRKIKYTEKAFNSGTWRTPQDALQSHLVEHVSEDPSNPIHPTGNYMTNYYQNQMYTSAWSSNLNRRKQNFGWLLADPQESEEKMERLEEQLLEDLSRLDPRVILHPLLEGAGLKPNSLMSTVNLKRLGVVISPSSTSIARSAQRDIFELSPIKQGQEPLGAKPEYSLKNSSVFSSNTLDEYLENEEKIIDQRAALCVNKTSKVVCQMPSKSSSYVRTLDSVLKSRSSQAECRGSHTSNRTSVSPQPISVGSVSKNTKQIEMTLGPVTSIKKSANNAKPKSAAKTSLRPSFAPTRPPRLSKKQRKLMNVENGARWVGKPGTYITEERAEASLVTLLTAKESRKGNNSGTVTAIKLNKCRNSTTIEAMDSGKLDGFESNSMSPNAAQPSKWKQKEKADSPLHCDSPQEETTGLQSETPQTSVETKNTLKLIEINSYCNWESERSNILGVLAQYTANKRPLEKIRIGNFLVEIVSNYGKSQDPSPGSVLISSSVVKISQSSEKEGNGKYSGCNMSVPTTSQSPGIQLTETPPIAPKETLPRCAKFTVQEKEFTGNANGDTKLTRGQVGAPHPVNWVIGNRKKKKRKKKRKIVEPFKTSSSSTVASSASAHLPSKHLTTCSTSSGNEVLRDINDATPVNQAKEDYTSNKYTHPVINKVGEVSKHPETSNSTPPDLSKATKSDRPQLLLIPLQSTSTARPAQNLQLTPAQKMILQPLRWPSGEVFQYPNGQIIQLVPPPNPGAVSRRNLHQKVTLAVRNPVSELDDKFEDASMDHQNALERPTQAELVDHSYTSEEQIMEEENENSALENSTRTGKGSDVDKDSSRSNHDVVDKEPDEMPSMEEKNWLQDEQVEVEIEDKKCWFKASTFNVPLEREEVMQKNPENEELDFHQRLLQYENFPVSDKDIASQSHLEDGDSRSDVEEIDVDRVFNLTSSEEAVDIETVEELSEKINIAHLVASASRLRSKSKCHFHNPYVTNKSNEEEEEEEEEEGDIKSKPKQIADLDKEAKDRLDALVVYLTAQTGNERRRRSKKRHLFEKLKKTLAIRGEEKVSKYFILKQAFAEIQNLQDYSDCLSAWKSIQTRRRDSLIRKVSLLTGKTEEDILKKLEYNCAKQRRLDVETRTSMLEGDDASEQHSVSWNTASISSMDSLQKVAMDLQIQKPPNVMMLCSGQDLISEAGRARPLILTRKHSSTPHM